MSSHRWNPSLRAFAAAAAFPALLSACDGADPGGTSPPDEPACTVDRDCQDGDLCDGVERCVAGRCVDDHAVRCEGGEVCAATGQCGLPPIAVPAPCAVPRGPVLRALPFGTRLAFSSDDPRPLEVGLALHADATAPDAWVAGAALDLPAADARSVTVFARASGEPDARCVFKAEVELVDAFPRSADAADSDAIAADDPRIVAWAAGWSEPVAWGTDLSPGLFGAVGPNDPRCALGPASGEPFDTASLGNGGALAMVLPYALGDAPGPDFAIFENGFSDQFLELAYVEVSSDGVHFARFDSVASGMTPLGPYDTLDASRVAGLAGRYRADYGTPFDLDDLRYHPLVQSGVLDLAAVTHVRVVDIIGDGTARDSFGNPIYDPTPTHGTAGFDLDAIAVLGL
ncbi:MAG: hypothetical protein U1F43_01415 [Myxococcota bacterium]